MGLLYYISGVRSSPLANDLKECGLDGQIVGGFVHTEIFLDGTQGAVFCLKGKCSGNEKIGFYVDEQKWTNIPNEDGKTSRLWIGYDINNKPIPKDFLKEDALEGHYLKLGDDNEWLIPIARRFNQGCLLPKSTSMLVRGRVDVCIVDKYIEIQKIAEQAFLMLNLDYEKTIEKLDGVIDTDANFFESCVKVLSTNYNVDYRDVSILKLFNTDSTIEVLKMFVDWPYIEELLNSQKVEDEKKRETQT